MTGAGYLAGYADPWSVRAGESVELFCTSDAPADASASVVRLGLRPDGTVDEREVLDLGPIAVTPQRATLGSCVLVAGLAPPPAGAPLVVASWCMPTRPGSHGRPLGRQSLLARTGRGGSFWLGLDEHGRPAVEVRASSGAAVSCRLEEALRARAWYLVAAGLHPEEGLSVHAVALRPGPSSSAEPVVTLLPGAARTPGRLPTGALGGDLLAIGATPADPSPRDDPLEPRSSGSRSWPSWGDCFDGKLESPQLRLGLLDAAMLEDLARPLEGSETREGAKGLLVSWELGPLQGGGARRVPARGPGAAGCDGERQNSPLAPVTGHSWDGSETDFRRAPAQYRAMHFHSDDLDDCAWPAAARLEVPVDVASGIHAVRLEAAGRPVEHVPFFIRPPAGRPGGQAPAMLFLAPTASYLAYANDHPVSDGDFSEATAGKTPVLFADDLLLHEHREWGLSMYDSHLDGSGVAYSSSRRPMLNHRPGHRYHVGPWQLPADLALCGWLDRSGFAYDVATDADLHAEGRLLLEPYQVLVSGTHPEYFSTEMLDALEAWCRSGGRLVVLGANGFYWRVAFDPDRPYVMELRRGHAGSRAWESAPGEVHLGFSGEPGGLWRHLGRAPQKLTGVGYAGQGFDASGWYRRLPASYDERVAFVFEGVDTDATNGRFGTSGSIGGGAVGQELDRADSALGTAADALVLATSEGLSQAYHRCVEEVPFTLPGLSAATDPMVRADLTYHVKPGGGAAFATGSIAWAGALDVDPAITRITSNVLERFADPAPLPW